MPGGKAPRRKGNRAEREVLKLLKEAGLEARRRFGLEGWLEGRGLLVLRPDRRPPIAVLPLERLLALLTRVGGGA